MDGHASHRPGLSRRVRLLALFALLAGVFLMHGPSADHDLSSTTGHGTAMAMSGSAGIAAAADPRTIAGGVVRAAHRAAPVAPPVSHSGHADGSCLAFLLAATTLIVLPALSARRRRSADAVSNPAVGPPRCGPLARDAGASWPPSLALLCLSRT
jgi:uncharacterized protein DUF6153